MSRSPQMRLFQLADWIIHRVPFLSEKLQGTYLHRLWHWIERLTNKKDCEHEWHADQDDQVNRCIKCYAPQKIHLTEEEYRRVGKCS